MGTSDGVLGNARAAIAAAAELAGADDQVEQLDLLPPSRFEGGASGGTNRTLNDVLRARGAGRPKGAQNVATREVRDFIRKVFGDPMVETGRWLMHTPETLAKELGCTLLEAFDRLQDMREALLPYFYAKLAPTDQEGRPVVPQFAMFMGDRVVGSGSGRPPWMEDPEVERALSARVVNSEQNQGLSDAAQDVSHADKSHDAPTH
jgi:hypothetical protein